MAREVVPLDPRMDDGCQIRVEFQDHDFVIFECPECGRGYKVLISPELTDEGKAIAVEETLKALSAKCETECPDSPCGGCIHCMKDSDIHYRGRL